MRPRGNESGCSSTPFLSFRHTISNSRRGTNPSGSDHASFEAGDFHLRLDRLRDETAVVRLVMKLRLLFVGRALVAAVDDLGAERDHRHPGRAALVLPHLADRLVLVALDLK